jgi:hypothetical protein
MRFETSTSPVPAKDVFYRRLVDRCREKIVEELGAERLLAILMIGAPARGEATVVMSPDGLLSLSDIDLVCVERPSGNHAALAAKLAFTVRSLNDELRQLCAGVDASLKTIDHVAGSSELIANYEMLLSPAVVWGDEGVLSSLPEPDISAVAPLESLVLIHNRIVEEILLAPTLAQSDLGDRDALAAIYRSAKLALDAVTAFLYLGESVPASYRDRVEAFTGAVAVSPGSARLAEKLGAFRDDLPAWGALKTEGDFTRLAECLGGRPDDPGELARRAWRRLAGPAEALWRAVLGGVLGEDLMEAGLPAVARRYSRLESPARKTVRALKALRPGAAPRGLFSPSRVLSRSTFASPRLLGHLTGVLAYLEAAGAGDEEWLAGAVIEYCPFTLPPDLESAGREERRRIVVERLALFHETILLGRTAEGSA